MSIFKQINEMANQNERAEVKQQFKLQLEKKHGIKASMDVVDAFIDGGDAPGLDKFVDAIHAAGFDTSGGYPENKKFLDNLGISKTQWNTLAVNEGLSTAERIANELLEKCGASHEDEERNAFSSRQKSDMMKLIKQYGNSFFRDNTREELGDDLEMLEYSPEEVESMIKFMMPQIQKMWEEQMKKQQK
jgi:hypothetical protein